MRGFKLVICLALSLALSASVSAQTVKDPALRVQEYTAGLSAPVNMAFLGTDDILILQKDDGRVRRVIGGDAHVLRRRQIVEQCVALKHQTAQVARLALQVDQPPGADNLP